MMDAVRWLALLLLVFPSLAVVREFVLVNQPMSWTDAQSYCRKYHLDLATVANEDNWARVLGFLTPLDLTDSSKTESTQTESSETFSYDVMTKRDLGSVDSTTETAWIGLYSDLNSWRWSLDNSLLYQDGNTDLGSWFTFSPENNGGNAFCVYMMNSVLKDDGCDNVRYFICYDEPTNTYHPLMETHNWHTAQEICRVQHTDLASVRNQEELQAINTAISHSRSAFWVGLSRDKWLWSNQRTSSFTAWAPSLPRSGLQGCVYANASGWTNDYCTTERPFICSTAATRVIKVVMKAKGPIDPNDPQILVSILKQKETLLRERGIGQEVKLKWREAPRGVVFNKTEL